MKSNKIFKALALFFFMGLAVSCSDSSSDDGGGDSVTSITLTASSASVIEGESVTFSVVDNLNNNVTANVALSINGSQISNPHTFTAQGSYNVVATLNSLTSTVAVVVQEPAQATSITLSVNLSKVTTMDDAQFTVMTNLGQNVTSLSSFSLGGMTITNPYMFSDLGDNTVEASYEGLTTTLTIDVVRGFTKKALLEDFTGTWCPNCPPAAAAVASAISGNPNIFGVGYHVGVSSYPDPMEIPETDFWGSYYHVTGYPTVYVNGPDTRWDFPNMTQVNDELAEETILGLAVEASIVGGMLDVEVKVGFNEVDPFQEELKLMVYLVEDNVTTNSAQAGSSSGTGYVHRDVLREVYTEQLGDVIPSGIISTSTDYERTFSGLTLPSNIDNTSNLKVIAYVRNTYTKTFTDYFNTVWTNSPHYDIYNVQEVHVGSSQDFD